MNLTIREIQILQLISDELTTSEIAKKLSLSEATIESHRRLMFKKIDAKNMVGLIKYGIKEGLIK